MEFAKYYGKYKRENGVCPQNIVPHKKRKQRILKFRVDEDLEKLIIEKCNDKEKSFSKLNRTLWLAYFKTEKDNAWKKEVEEWE